MPKGTKGIPQASCHPECLHYALGKCKNCYFAGRQSGESARVHKYYGAHGRARHYQITYGISLQSLSELLKTQNNSCAICNELFGDAAPHLDHNHANNTTRGLLCGKCNRGLGMFRDDPVLLKSAITYLQRHT